MEEAYQFLLNDKNPVKNHCAWNTPNKIYTEYHDCGVLNGDFSIFHAQKHLLFQSRITVDLLLGDYPVMRLLAQVKTGLSLFSGIFLFDFILSGHYGAAITRIQEFVKAKNRLRKMKSLILNLFSSDFLMPRWFFLGVFLFLSFTFFLA